MMRKFLIKRLPGSRFLLEEVTEDEFGRSHGEVRAASASLGYLRGLIPAEFRKTNGDCSKGITEVYEVIYGQQKIPEAMPSQAYSAGVY